MEHVKQQANSKRRLKLGDIAEHLQLKKFVVRAWEKELGLAPHSGLYGADDVELFKKIKQLVLVERKSLDQVREVIGASRVLEPSAGEVAPAIHDIAREQGFEVASSTDLGDAVEAIVELAAASEEEPATLVSDGEVKVLPAESLLVSEIPSAGGKLTPVLETAAEEKVGAAQMINEAAQQKFLVELAFFKQELLRFKELLKS